MKLYEPKPFRNMNDWKQGQAFNTLAPKLTLELLIHRGLVNCRECLGFGHARTNCPTRRKLTEIAQLSPYIRCAVGQYRATVLKEVGTSNYSTWPGIDFLNKWEAATATKLAGESSAYDDVRAVLKKNFDDLAKLECRTCSGFGHISDDYQFKRSSHARVGECPT